MPVKNPHPFKQPGLSPLEDVDGGELPFMRH